ncbi:5-methyltetrahydropteroyltriglutamate--homocysteine S-methyltransferase [Oceanobacillus bengalensis]|uniref:5-methyltetrahydropteroyltriglutamate--homocysteine S-methyltransferase n=1 Tax=Oceanobacillus bengalensis TaxID=1435466 RepID=A0A494Z7N4_9BACI|nr:5-methyltetrahydropteroyltriglutamate--homocysteine S-methyltransferase [Oceanobacillus bengalensis]RKQ18603.1 5-methyltetrahydropteroyltriglutamate--homocysteine S-methyltransferase [Oceanobacillus bengalensis]
MIKTQLKAPFRADQVGSLLRPENLKKAKKDYTEGKITAEQLREIELQEIKQIVDKQVEVGLQAVTEGEFGRDWWHSTFMEHLLGAEGYVPNHGYDFAHQETDPYDVRLVDKVAYNPNHPFFSQAKDLVDIVGNRAVVKFTIPSPNQFFHPDIINGQYKDFDAFAPDIIEAYRQTIKTFYQIGVRYLQLDDVYLAVIATSDFSPEEKKYRAELAVRVVNSILEDKPEDLTVTTHICRGNYRSDYFFAGGYDDIAPIIFANEKVDGFFLEYDDERSGSFEALKYIPEGGPRVVLGLVTSKTGKLEDNEAIKARVQEASKYIPIEQLCISPQCGFASTHHGNILTEEEQWAKLEFIVKTAKEIWE